MSGEDFNTPPSPPSNTHPDFHANPNEGTDSSNHADIQNDETGQRGPDNAPSNVRIYTRQVLIRGQNRIDLLSTLNEAVAAVSGRITGFYGIGPVEPPEQERDIFELRITMESSLHDLAEFLRVFQLNNRLTMW
eukprot:CAMPEP_0118648102 /NCGR_PEP_ID=MMETSP0785-20121206/8970_1 /TAXON_ID=91992 /ORGANISM="Bolidomonas pacifica, Strain CCMP 1866" /LENGTH=133 /DNA_ID=CAMNT_0006540259 /DNA_START=81 /DNA_END=479 /DNA_ORIENTATION=+